MKRYETDELKEGLKLFFQPYLEGYRKRVNEIYTVENDESSSFSYMKPVRLHVLLRDKNTHLIFTSADVDEIEFFDFNETSREEFEKLSSSSEKIKDDFIKSIIGTDNYLAHQRLSQLGEFGGISFAKGNQHTLSNRSRQWGIEKADSHYNNYRFSLAFEKSLIPSSELIVVDTEKILERVPDPSFQYEFGESAKAYNAGLYLAAASTGGLALENILRLLIVKMLGEDELPGETYIRTSLKRLEKGNILPGRLHGAVDSLKNIRNSNSHTNEDPVKQTTVDHLFATIEDLSKFLVR